jgi:two-component system, response regulator / RNA-binding antiterminator
MSKSLEILIAHIDDRNSLRLQTLLEDLDHQVVRTVTSGDELVETFVRLEPDLVISHSQLLDGVRALQEALRHHSRPVVMIGNPGEPSLAEPDLTRNVMAWLFEPVRPQTLRPALFLAQQLFRQSQELHQRVAALTSALEARRRIDEAKRLLMGKEGMDEPTAYASLRKRANDQRTTMARVADTILDGDGDGNGNGNGEDPESVRQSLGDPVDERCE